MSEREACTLASAFWQEVQHLNGAEKIQSAGFFQVAERLSRTQHECELSSHFPQMGLSAGIEMSYMDVGLNAPHPVLDIANVFKVLDRTGNLDLFLMGNRSREFRQFWNKWRNIEPNHPLFKESDLRQSWAVPVAVHCDEGTGQKKRPIMIVQYQPILGTGTSKRKRDSDPGLNYLGNSLGTRFLYSVMVGRLYSGKKLKNKPLLKLFAHLGNSLAGAMSTGFDIHLDGKPRKIWLYPIGMKGDWPALTKVAGLTRHFGKDKPTKEFGDGVCHLCRGGQEGMPWHDLSEKNMKRLRAGVELPWKATPSLLKPLKIPTEYQASFFRIDIFHTCHKGVMADIAANTIVPWLCFYIYSDRWFSEEGLWGISTAWAFPNCW